MLNDCVFDRVYDIVSSIFDAPERDIVVWIEQNTKCFIDFNQWYKDCNLQTRLDTTDREHVLDVVALYFLKRHWPSFGDGKDAYSQFLTDLSSAIMRYQWKLRESYSKAA